MKYYYFIFIILVVGVLVFANFGFANGTEIILYKEENCGCCEGHGKALREAGFNVNIKVVESLREIKTKFNIPLNLSSCHTSVIQGYFVEGHVPIDIIEQLIIEKPNVDGIGLTGMPTGTPGMPGLKTEIYEIYSIKNGIIKSYKRV